jgi:predicted GNAT superfamily acetyltransferase
VADQLRRTPTSLGATALAAEAVATDVRVRPLRSNEDCHACVDLQRHVWGFEQGEVVPSTLLHVVDYVGGLAAGAFDSQNNLLGFVFGITGVRDGALAHWSHMLGVHESARNLGVGRMLKEYQRETLAAIGVTRIYWSFDPLMAKNAYFNINRLGALVTEYIPDMYGTTASPLHLGMATDRLIVRLDTAGDTTTAPRSAVKIASDHGLPILTPFPRLNDVTLSVGDWSPELVLIEMPAEVLAVLERSPGTAQTWRLAVRDHFRWALKRGYSVAGVYRNASTDRAFYLLSRGTEGLKSA